MAIAGDAVKAGEDQCGQCSRQSSVGGVVLQGAGRELSGVEMSR